MLQSRQPLPPGQRERADFPRFGLTPYAERHPRTVGPLRFTLQLGSVESIELHRPLDGLPRRTVTADFHCVTTWSRRGLQWEGVAFSDFFGHHLGGRRLGRSLHTVVLRGEDGYRTTLPLADLLQPDCLLADRLEGQALGIEHGAPLRLVAPAHYGYKSVKHLSALRFLPEDESHQVRPAAFAFMDHPRARVAFEERGRWVPGRLLRHLYRPLVDRTVARFADAMRRHPPEPSSATEPWPGAPTP